MSRDKRDLQTRLQLYFILAFNVHGNGMKTDLMFYFTYQRLDGQINLIESLMVSRL